MPPPAPRSWQAPSRVVERELSGIVRSRNNLVFDESLADDVVVYPAKKTKASLWRKVGSKRLELEPTVREYDAWDMGRPGWSGGYSGPAAYGPPPPPGAYMRR